MVSGPKRVTLTNINTGNEIQNALRSDVTAKYNDNGKFKNTGLKRRKDRLAR